MGLDIIPIKVGKRLRDYIPGDDWEDEEIIISNLNSDYGPIEHLPVIKEGVYELLDAKFSMDSYDFSSSYSSYNTFRNMICNSVYGLDQENIWADLDNYIGKPFIELINFSDSEGFFDYKVAEKLLGDFENNLYKNKFLARSKMLHSEDTYEWLKSFYEDYTNLLKAVIEVKGVAQYC